MSAKQVGWPTRGSIPSLPTDSPRSFSGEDLRLSRGGDGFDSHTRRSQFGPFVYRNEDTSPSSWEDGFDSHTGYMAKWWNQQTHGPQKAGPRKGRESATLSLVTYCRYGRRLIGFHKAGVPGSLPGPATVLRVDQCPAAAHNHCNLVQLLNPRLDLAKYANRQSGQVESLASVGSTPTLVTVQSKTLACPIDGAYILNDW